VRDGAIVAVAANVPAPVRKSSTAKHDLHAGLRRHASASLDSVLRR